ncbi:MAG: hypothetical protein AAB352_03345 [Patescibacteria group bacterium]
MEIFSILLIALFIATAIYYAVFFSLIYYWHLKKITFVIVPLIFTFEFFAVGFLIISIIYILIKYLPQLFVLFK